MPNEILCRKAPNRISTFISNVTPNTK